MLREETFGGDLRARARVRRGPVPRQREQRRRREVRRFEHDARGKLDQAHRPGRQRDDAGSSTDDRPMERDRRPTASSRRTGTTARGALIEVNYPSGLRFTLDYDGHGRVTAVYGAEGRLAAFALRRAAQPRVEERRPRRAHALRVRRARAARSRARDALGRVTRVDVRSPRPAGRGPLPGRHQRRAVEYEPRGNVTRVHRRARAARRAWSTRAPACSRSSRGRRAGVGLPVRRGRAAAAHREPAAASSTSSTTTGRASVERRRPSTAASSSYQYDMAGSALAHRRTRTTRGASSSTTRSATSSGAARRTATSSSSATRAGRLEEGDPLRVQRQGRHRVRARRASAASSRRSRTIAPIRFEYDARGPAHGAHRCRTAQTTRYHYDVARRARGRGPRRAQGLASSATCSAARRAARLPGRRRHPAQRTTRWTGSSSSR